MDLNEQQKAFVYSDIDGAVRVLAGPGSGKTASLAHRIAHMIQNGIDPSNILAVTFSKVMAAELQDRIVKLSPAAENSQICTIHALCYRILKEEGEKRRVPPDHASSAIHKNARAALDAHQIAEIGWKDFLSYVGNAKFHAIRHNGLEAFYFDKIQRNGGIDPEIPWADNAHRLIAAAHIEFDRLMHSMGLLTFDDMLCEVEWLFEDFPAVLEKYQNRYKYIIVDEAQDTSKQAMRILAKLAYKFGNFTVVGDADQTIYEFSGADPEDNLWAGFERRFTRCRTYKLETNYRSTTHIVDLTNRAIAANYTNDTLQYRKQIIPADCAEDGITTTYKVYKDAKEEAEEIVTQLDRDLWDNGRDPSDFFICSRTRAQLPYLYGAMFRNRIPFLDLTGGSFWDMAHIQDILAYLRLSDNKMDDIAFTRVYNKASTNMKQPFDLYDISSGKLLRARGAYVNHRWLGKAFLEAAGGSWSGIFDAMDRKYGPGIADLVDFMRNLDGKSSVSERVDYIVENCLSSWWQMEEGGLLDVGSGGKADDFATVADLASGFDTTQEFLEHVDSIRQAIERAKDSKDAVILSTIHRLKGLERPIVYVIGVMDGLLPHHAALHTMKALGILPFSNTTKIESERRLFFVAISRAMEEIRLTGCWSYQGRSLSKSMFAYECNLATEGVASDFVDKLFGEE